MAALVLFANIGWTAWAQARFGTQSGIGTIFLGSCVKAKRLSLWLHLLINILSTLLLGASNFCMQLLVAPTRHEVNRAHERSFWLDIGTPSVRNLRHIARSKALRWLCLGFSSALLHLSYVRQSYFTLQINEIGWLNWATAGTLHFFYQLPFIHIRLLLPQKIIWETMILGVLKILTASDKNLQLMSNWIILIALTVISIVLMAEKTSLLSLIGHLLRITTQPCLVFFMSMISHLGVCGFVSHHLLASRPVLVDAPNGIWINSAQTGALSTMVSHGMCLAIATKCPLSLAGAGECIQKTANADYTLAPRSWYLYASWI